MPDSPQDILERATQRARAAQLGYRGAVTPAEAQALIASGVAQLIDVRTRFEWDYVGHIPGTTLIEWKQLPGNVLNPDFLEQLAATVSTATPLLFLCRSGVRSHAAALAATEAGYQSAFNILEGFEGDLDEHQQRGHKNGWRFAGLPWVQG